MQGTIYIILLFLCFVIQWKIKRRLQLKKTGADPEVLKHSLTSLQRFMYSINIVLTVMIVILIIIHGAGIIFYSLFSMFPPIDYPVYDHVGFAAGISGLAVCLYAQIVMGNSWRVGIDENNSSELITTGLYKFIRNPTYLGIFILLTGIWLIWPTWSIALFCLLFYFFLEVQVRCEEDYLQRVHGENYLNYLNNTKRYIPFIY